MDKREMTTEERYELQRRQLWIDVAIAYTGASNSTSQTSCANWANSVLDAFDKKFKDQQK